MGPRPVAKAHYSDPGPSPAASPTGSRPDAPQPSSRARGPGPGGSEGLRVVEDARAQGRTLCGGKGKCRRRGRGVLGRRRGSGVPAGLMVLLTFSLGLGAQEQTFCEGGLPGAVSKGRDHDGARAGAGRRVVLLLPAVAAAETAVVARPRRADAPPCALRSPPCWARAGEMYRAPRLARGPARPPPGRGDARPRRLVLGFESGARPWSRARAGDARGRGVRVGG